MVNGIGTTYYGKKNIQKRPGPCPHCGRAVELKSYDTRTWFVIFLIPIIPLKRLRIIDYCSACTRHYAMEADKWETARQLEVSGAQEKYRTNPTPEAAIEVHQNMMNYHQLEDATAFRQTMREKYADNAKVHAYLGAVLERFAQLDEATAAYTRAYELRADLPEARIGVARGYLRSGKLTEARGLLDFLEKPGASQLYSLEPLDTLAREYQKAERHEDALALFAIIQKELPHLNEQRWFRDLIYKSEKALKRTESQVPKQKFSLKRFFTSGETSNARALMIFGIIGALVALGFVIANEYIRRHRTVHIVNAYKQIATVQVDGREPVKVHGLGEIVVAEGKHHAVISGPVQQEVDFEIKEGYWGRWGNDPAWVLNLGGAAILELTHVTYAKNDPPPPRYWFSFGENFRRFPEVSHAFEELPEKIQVKAGESKTLTHLEVMSGDPASLFYYYYTEQKNLPEALRLAEWRLRVQPEDDAILVLYAQTARAAKQSERLEKFLQAGLTNRPVRIPWHRYYQNLTRDQQGDALLAAGYRAELERDPTNSALMYLLGRVAATRAESRQLFERACAADTNNAFAFYACAFDHISRGDWAGARPLLVHACALRPQQAEFGLQLQRVRFALEEYAELEKELRHELNEQPLDYSACTRLCEVLVAAGRRAEAVTFADNFRRQARSQAGARVAAANHELECHVFYLTGDFAALRQATTGPTDAFNKYQCYVAEIELGHALEAIKILPPRPEADSNPFHFLNTAIALRAADQPEEAARWLQLGLAILDKGDADWKNAAAWLRRAAPPFAAHEEFSLPAESKVAVLATAAQLHPELRADLLPLIARLNRLPEYPHHLIETTMANLK